jgi:hypothetical protein
MPDFLYLLHNVTAVFLLVSDPTLDDAYFNSADYREPYGVILLLFQNLEFSSSYIYHLQWHFEVDLPRLHSIYTCSPGYEYDRATSRVQKQGNKNQGGEI